MCITRIELVATPVGFISKSARPDVFGCLTEHLNRFLNRLNRQLWTPLFKKFCGLNIMTVRYRTCSMPTLECGWRISTPTKLLGWQYERADCCGQQVAYAWVLNDAFGVWTELVVMPRLSPFKLATYKVHRCPHMPTTNRKKRVWGKWHRQVTRFHYIISSVVSHICMWAHPMGLLLVISNVYYVIGMEFCFSEFLVNFWPVGYSDSELELDLSNAFTEVWGQALNWTSVRFVVRKICWGTGLNRSFELSSMRQNACPAPHVRWWDRMRDLH